jgi:hypothetical protein
MDQSRYESYPYSLTIVRQASGQVVRSGTQKSNGVDICFRWAESGSVFSYECYQRVNANGCPLWNTLSGFTSTLLGGSLQIVEGGSNAGVLCRRSSVPGTNSYLYQTYQKQ